MNTDESQAYVVIAHHHARKGAGDEVAAALVEHGKATLGEQGCVAFAAQRSIADPDSFAMYEKYRSEADWDRHQTTAHYQKYVVDTIKPLLVSREVDFYRVTVDADTGVLS